MEAFPSVSVDLSKLTAEPAGAVLIELEFGPRPGGRYGKRDAQAVLEQIFAILSEANLGVSCARALIPESITLIWYGENAQAMFEACGNSCRITSSVRVRSCRFGRAKTSGRS